MINFNFHIFNHLQKKIKPLRFFLLNLAGWWHPYVDVKYINIKKILNDFNGLKLSKKLGRFVSIFMTGTGVLQIKFENFYILIPCGSFSSSSLRNNIENYNRIKNSYLGELVSYEFESFDINNRTLYLIETLFPLNDKDIIYSYEIFRSKLISCSKIVQLKSIIPKLSSDEVSVNNVFSELLFSLEYKNEKLNFGFVHGDLTPDNIMLNKIGFPVLIDLDRSCFDCYQVYDEIHFYFQYESKINNLFWFDLIVLDENVTRWGLDNLIYYFLVRLSNELSRDSRPTGRYIKKLVSCGYSLLRKH